MAIELGGLPLALEQAAAYAGQYLTGHPHPLGRYLELFVERHKELLLLGRPLAYRGTIDATFTLALDRLRDRSKPAVALLEILSLLAPDEIPVHLLLGQPENLPSSIADAAHDPLAKDEVLGALIQASLLALDPSGAARTHRLLQTVVRNHLSGSTRQQRIQQAVELFSRIFPDEGWEPDQQPLCTQLLPHAQSVLDHATKAQVTTLAMAQLLIAVGNYLWGTELALHDAHDLHKQAVSINLGLYRDDHPEVARSLTALAADLRLLGELDQARELDTKALETRQRLYQDDHPDLARSLTALAGDLRRLGDLDEARTLDTQALEMRRRLYQGDHPAIACSTGNLAVDLHLLREWDRARDLNAQALEMFQRLYKGRHPRVATILSNLANDLYMLGKAREARELDLQALEIRQRLYDPDHPTIVESLRNLAADMCTLGQADEARGLDAKASAMYRRLYGAAHPDTSRSSGSLADAVLFPLPDGRLARAIDDQHCRA